MSADPRALLRELLQAALARVHGGRAVARALREEPLSEGPVRLLAAGKAAAPMAEAAREALGERLGPALVVTKPGHAEGLAGFCVLEAGHPVPDAVSEAAGREALELARTAGPEEIFLVLLSGGASSLLSVPGPGISRQELASTTEGLLRGGADIRELNAVRKHLGETGGGRLARASGAGRIEVLALSDVPGDDPATLASGPCAADPTTWADAAAVVERILGDGASAAVRRALAEGVAGQRPESVKGGDPALERVRTRLVGSNADARDAVVERADALGLAVNDLGEALEGEARDAADALVRRVLEARSDEAEGLWLAGGETTVTVRGPGRGGRSQELALAAALALDGAQGITLLAAGTDGSDGPTDAAGAFADGESVKRGLARGADARDCLERNDSHAFFAREGGLLRTGPTGTNVMDLVLIHRASRAAAPAPGR